MKIICHLALFIIGACLLEARIFTSLSGKSIEASFAGFEGKKVLLRLASGKKVSYPISKLSKQDIEYLKNHPALSLPTVVIDPTVNFPVHNKILQTCFIDRKGKIVKTHQFRLQELPVFSGGAFLTEVGGIYNAFYDKKGKNLLLSSKQLGVYRFNDSSWDDDLICAMDVKAKLNGYVNHKGKTVIPFVYSSAGCMRGKRAWVRKKGEKTLTLIDEQGKEIVTVYSSSAGEFSHGFSRVSKEIDGKYIDVFYDVSGKPVFTDKNLPNRISCSFIEGHAVVGSGIINTKGDWTMKPDAKNEFVTSGKKISDGVALFTNRQDGKYVMNIVSIHNGKVVATLSGEDDYKLLGDGVISARRGSDGLNALYDRLGNPLTGYLFKHCYDFNQGYALAKLEGESERVVINRKGEVIFKFSY